MLKLLGLSGILLLPSIVRSQIQDQCPLQGLTPSKLTGTHNFVIDLFSNMIRFPYAINQCTATELTANSKWYKYTCDGDSSTVTKTEYTDPDCSSNGTLLTDWAVANNTDFECGGINTYVELQLSLSNNCSTGVTVFAGLSACVDASAGFGQYQFYCNTSTALLEFYQSMSNMSESTFLPTDLFTTGIESTFIETTEIIESTENPGATSTSVASTTSAASTTSTSVGSTSTTNIATTSTAGNLGRAVNPTDLMTTWVATLFAEELYCDDSSFCNAWPLSRRRCSRIELPISQDTSVVIYGQMARCQPRSFETTLPGKSSSIRPRLAISGLITLLLFICLL